MKPVEFKCKHPGCSLTVRYERQTKPGAYLKRPTKNSPAGRTDQSETFAAYLECAKGHVERYEIPRSEMVEKQNAG